MMAVTTRLVALVSLLICIATTLASILRSEICSPPSHVASKVEHGFCIGIAYRNGRLANSVISPIYPDTSNTDLVERQIYDTISNLRAEQEKARDIPVCSIFSSVRACTWNDTWCRTDALGNTDCRKRYQSHFTDPTEKLCQSLMQLDERDNVEGGPMQCVKNQGDFFSPANCSDEWNGDWVVFDNEDCDWSGQTYQWSVQSGNGPPRAPVQSTHFAAKSVMYLSNDGYFQFAPPGSKKRDIDHLEERAGDSNTDADAKDTNTTSNAVASRDKRVEACSLFTSSLPCANPNAWCTFNSCPALVHPVYQWKFSPTDKSCHNLSATDLNDRQGTDMFCFKNQEAADGTDRCDVGWSGYWIVYDNDHCDENGQVFNVPVYADGFPTATGGQNFEMPSAGLSVRYNDSPDMPTASTAAAPSDLRAGTESDLFARQEGECELYTSLLSCLDPEVWCRGSTCTAPNDPVFDWSFQANDTSCRNLMGDSEVEGGPMYCVRNPGLADGWGGCDVGWAGWWIFYDNPNCNETGQVFNVPVDVPGGGMAAGVQFELVSPAQSVRWAAVDDMPRCEGGCPELYMDADSISGK